MLYAVPYITSLLKLTICLFPVGWTLFFSIPIVHVIKLLSNNVIYIYFKVSFYSIAFIANQQVSQWMADDLRAKTEIHRVDK